ncbi:MAG: hypothetical protein NWS01_07105 [Burkholderiales bacterium]|jgi:hypothetical protein|nr:hypothetical protein [Burkholderiales bacterium]|tara:strand:+ start:1844 stop:2752 length:909 start_codon:yes stop_codon:yes gene_type:complete
MLKHLLILTLILFHPAYAQEQDPKELASDIEESSSGITDPFSRGITRPIEFGSIDNSNFDRIDNVRGLSDPRYYRVISLELNGGSFKPRVTDMSKKPSTSKTNGFFISILFDIDANMLKEEAQVILRAHADKISTNFFIHAIGTDENPDQLTLDYGPFKSNSVAKKHCYYLREMIREDFSVSCDQILRMPTDNSTFIAGNDQALVGLSQAGILHFMNSSMRYNANDLIDLSLAVKSGEPLGPRGYIITHINRYGIYLANIKGDVALIPTFSIPINDAVSEPTEADKGSVSDKSSKTNAPKKE